MKVRLIPGGRGDSTLIRRACATGVSNLPPCPRAEKPRKYTLFRSQEIMYRTVSYRIVSYRIVSYRIVSYRIVSYRIVSYRIVSYRIVLYCIVLYCIVLYCIALYRVVLYRIGGKDHIYAIKSFYHSILVLPCLCKRV